jgi:hypothetical protein
MVAIPKRIFADEALPPAYLAVLCWIWASDDGANLSPRDIEKRFNLKSGMGEAALSALHLAGYIILGDGWIETVGPSR